MQRAKTSLITFAGVSLLIAGMLTIGRATASHQADRHESTPVASAAASPVGNTGTGAAYMEIRNEGADADTLLGATADVSQAVEVHSMEMEGGVMTMRPLPEGLAIPAGETTSLKPQGYHVMLINLTRDLRPGDQFQLTLTFAKAGDVAVNVVVGTGKPEDAEPVTAGSLSIEGAWSRPAPMLDGGAAQDHPATPVATPTG